MATRRYAVVQVGEEWRIIGEQRHIGHFHSCADATLATTRLGALAQEEGCSVELLVQQPFGELKPMS